MRFFDPFGMMQPAIEAAEIMAESQIVIGLRLAGMAGFWPMAKAENARMVSEKLQASIDMGHAAVKASLSGASPAQMAMAVMAPMHRKTRSNAKRLQRKVIGL
jgi:hypothetical protein